jgi:hypothetical protein
VLDRLGELAARVEQELRDVEPEKPAKSMLVAPQDPANLDALLAIAEPLAKSVPPRELIIAEVVVPTRFVTGVRRDADEVAAKSAGLNERRKELARQGVVARSVAFTSVVPGQDYVRLASEQEVDLILLDGRRPLLGGGVPRGAVGHVLEKAPCDVAVLVERQEMPKLDPEHPDHDAVRRRRPRLRRARARLVDLIRDGGAP